MKAMRYAIVGFGMLLVSVNAATQQSSAAQQSPSWKIAAVHQATQPTVLLDIAAQPMEKALQAFAAQSGLQVIFPTELTDAITAPRLKGSYTPERALATLLANTDLRFEYVNARTVAIRPVVAERRRNSSAPVTRALEGTTGEFRVAQTEPSSSPASAPEQPSSRETQKTEIGDQNVQRLEEIIVTAQKRTERLLDVPQSVSVLAGDALAKADSFQFRDFASTVPALSFQTEGAGLTQLSLRGVTVGKDAGATVGIYVDDAPYGSTSTFARGGQVTLDAGLFDLERIEILRGPQGTLYGAATMGGLLKYVTKAPDAVQLGGELRAGVSGTRHGGTNYDVAAMINVPIVSDKFALRASAYESHDGGYIDNLALGADDVNDADIYGGRIDLLFRLSEKLSLRLTGFLQDIERNGFPYAGFTYTGPVDDELSQRRSISETFDQKVRLGSGTLSYDFGPTSLVSISSYQTIQTDFVTDLPSFVGLCAAQGCVSVASPDFTKTDKFTQEVRLSSAAGGPVEWIIGAFYTDESSNFNQSLTIRGAMGQALANNLFTFSLPSEFTEYAAFGDLTWHISDRFDVTGGIRYAHHEQSFRQTGTGAFGLSSPVREASDSAETYLANARYRFNEHQIGYGRFATGYRPGGPNVLVTNPNTGQRLGPATFDSDSLRSYELGYKGETKDERFGFDLSAYRIDWDDIITTVIVGGFASRQNAPGGATINGGELTLFVRPFEALSLTGMVSYQDATLSEAYVPLRASAGQRLPTVPRITASLTSDYVLRASTLRPTFGTTISYADDRPASFGNPVYVLPSYTTVDLRAGITVASIDMHLYVRNVFDERGELTPRVLGSNTTSSLTVPFLVSITQPRTVGLSATKKF